MTNVTHDTFIHHCYRASVQEIPNTYEEAVSSPESRKWKKAMDEEMQSLKDNDSYELAYIPEGQKVIGSRWVYALKPVADGEKFKARFVAKGFTQEKDVDYEETFAPTVKMTTLRAFI